MATASRRGAAVVTGASRGLGRGIALALGAAGYTVYVTGRSDARPSGDRPGTVHETVAAIEAAGGRGVAVVCDHLDDAQTARLFAQVEAEQGGLALLVNNAFGMPDWAATDSPFWERPLSLWRDIIDIGLRSSYVASVLAAPLLLAAGPGGLIANISGPGAKTLRHSLPYGVGKAGQDKLAHDMARDLRPHGIAAISLWPGLVATERTLGNIARGNVGGLPDIEAYLESELFTGRAIAAAHAAPELMALSGGTFYSAELAERFGVEDAEGRHPRSRRVLYGAPLFGPIGEA